MRAVALTGAGVSAESGLKTFRGADGLWEGHRVEEVATPEAFTRDPEKVQRFYNQRRRHLLTARPNAAHEALAAFEKNLAARGGEFLLITQNIDDLHERAGSENLIHMHGELLKTRCEFCGEVFAERGEVAVDAACAKCQKRGGVRPHIVWFGEMPMQMERIYDALSACDIFFAVGTSGLVYPAAGFVQAARAAGARTAELNLDASAVSDSFHEIIIGKATEIVPRFCESLLAAA